MRSTVIFVLVVWGGHTATGAPDEPTLRLRLMPSRVAAHVAAGSTDAAQHPGWRKLESVIESRKLVAAAPRELVYTQPASGAAKPELRSLVRRLWYDERDVPPAAGDVTFVRLPAALALERRSRVTGSLPPAAGPPAPALKARGVTYTGTYTRMLIPDGEAQDLYERWTVEPAAGKRVDIGLYTDLGAHPNAVMTAAAACMAAGLTLRVLDAASVNAGTFRKQIRCLLMPGGWAGHYVTDINADGLRHIRALVDSGGGYVGVCAGAFYAMNDIVWEGEAIDYPLDLVAGSAVGPVAAIAPWPGHALAPLTLETSHPIAKGLKPTRAAFYLGGPALTPDAKLGKRARVVARYADTKDIAILTTRRKRGRVFLAAVHLEYDLTSDRDDLTWPESEGKLKDPESDWDLFQRGVRWAVGTR